MRIQSITANYYNQYNQKAPLVTDPIAFEARVDKGLSRFFSTNVDRMPNTVRTFIEKLPDKASHTPIQAQQGAFAALAGLTSIAAIQAQFPEDEELFKDLKDPDDSKASRGILGVYRENKELLKLFDRSILESKENFTVWLVKKVLLEGKTLEEINQDFDREMDKEFHVLYKSKEESKEPIRPSTLKALGIKMPEAEYMQSLRYTRDGYSDLVGERISEAQKKFWDSMPPEERTARARKSVQKFENWWNSMTRDQQLDLIAMQADELELLSRFNSSEQGKTRSTSKQKEKPESNTPKTPKEKTETSLSRDDLFKIWAGNNLKLFEASLTDYDRRKLELKRVQRQAEWWDSMSPKERTEYINKLKAGAEPMKYAMIEAWNNNPDILIELSHALKKFHLNKPFEAIYGVSENELMSQIMTDFWESHPDFADRLGDSLREAHDKIKTSIDNGNFELTKRDIMKNRIKREKETLEEMKNYREILPDEVFNSYPDYLQEFIEIYNKSNQANFKTLPAAYLREFYEVVNEDLSKEQTISWTKALKQEQLTNEDLDNLQKIMDMESPKSFKINRTLEATLADILYRCTLDPKVYLMSHADCKLAMKQIADGRERITVGSNKTGQEFNLPIVDYHFDIKEIDKLYNQYIETVSQEEAEAIAEQFFDVRTKNFKTFEEYLDYKDALVNYIQLNGGSNRIPFSFRTKHSPEIRQMFMQKYLSNMTNQLDISLLTCKLKTISDFQKEDKINLINRKLQKKYNFIPQKVLSLYLYELDQLLRHINMTNINQYEQLCCKQKTSTSEDSNVVLLDRDAFRADHKTYVLGVEQALADVLYEATGNEKVYALTMEELLDNLECFRLIKKFPSKKKWTIASSKFGEAFELKLLKSINYYKLERLTTEYIQEIQKYLQECIKENKPFDKEELLYILNPEEDKPEIDKHTLVRITEIMNLFNKSS